MERAIIWYHLMKHGSARGAPSPTTLLYEALTQPVTAYLSSGDLRPTYNQLSLSLVRLELRKSIEFYWHWILNNQVKYMEKYPFWRLSMLGWCYANILWKLY